MIYEHLNFLYSIFYSNLMVYDHLNFSVFDFLQ